MTLCALVLAAGMGSRLLPLTAERPKALVEVAGRSLLERLLIACRDAGVSEAVVVTGYRREAIDAWIARAAPLPTRTVFNADYETINNAHSVWVARRELEGADFLKLDGDLLLGPELLQRLAAAPGSALCLDRSPGLDEEAMKARVDSGRVSALGKWLSITEAAGESIGAERIAARDAPALFEAIERTVQREGRQEAYYEDVYHRLIEQGWRLDALEVTGAAWCEVDDAADLARANELALRLDGAPR